MHGRPFLPYVNSTPYVSYSLSMLDHRVIFSNKFFPESQLLFYYVRSRRGLEPPWWDHVVNLVKSSQSLLCSLGDSSNNNFDGIKVLSITRVRLFWKVVNDSNYDLLEDLLCTSINRRCIPSASEPATDQNHWSHNWIMSCLCKSVQPLKTQRTSDGHTTSVFTRPVTKQCVHSVQFYSDHACFWQL